MSSRAAHKDERALSISGSIDKRESSLCVCAHIVYYIIIKGLFFSFDHEKKDHNSSSVASFEIGSYYETFIEECPNCICSRCPHANICIERVRPDE